MTDEKFVFINDSKEKKITARSSHNRRTHAGKGGSVKFPSDFMTKKEVKALSGEVRTYRMNDPITWKEFLAMPDDIKASYIKIVREKYNAPDSAIARMMDAKQPNLSKIINKLGLGLGRGTGNQKWNKEGFLAWCGENGPETVEPVCNASTVAEPEFFQPVEKKTGFAMCSGNLDLTGNADSILEFVSDLLGGANVNMRITWEVCTEEWGVDAFGK